MFLRRTGANPSRLAGHAKVPRYNMRAWTLPYKSRRILWMLAKLK